MSAASGWHVYLLQCADGTFYTGITTDLARRVNEHNSPKKGARYTRSRQPVALVYSEPAKDRATAAQREYAIRTLARTNKQQLAARREGLLGHDPSAPAGHLPC